VRQALHETEIGRHVDNALDRPAQQQHLAAAIARGFRIERMRPTFDEKVVTATLPSAASMTLRSPSPTSFSDGETPSRIALVESQISASTPWSPSFSKALRSVFGPIDGSSSSFQSPVCSTVPSGVLIASETGSGMEWVTATVLISKEPIFNVSPGWKTVTSIFGAPGSDCALASSSPAVKAVAWTGSVPSGEIRG
jgi:hypothetical protein